MNNVIKVIVSGDPDSNISDFTQDVYLSDIRSLSGAVEPDKSVLQLREGNPTGYTTLWLKNSVQDIFTLIQQGVK